MGLQSQQEIQNKAECHPAQQTPHILHHQQSHSKHWHIYDSQDNKYYLFIAWYGYFIKNKCEYSLNKRIPSILPYFLPLFIIIGIIKQKQDYKICEPTFLPQFGEISGFRLALWIIRSLECSSDKIKFDSFWFASSMEKVMLMFYVFRSLTVRRNLCEPVGYNI